MKHCKLLVAFLLILALFLNIGCQKTMTKKAALSISTGKPLTFPTKLNTRKFGFLGGGPDSVQAIKEFGGYWLRPHPGPFLWDSMQSEGNEKIIFDKADRIVMQAQEGGVGTLATLWPFAEWDQKRKPNADKYKVSENDEFVAGMKDGRMDYLPLHRSNPADWQAYEKWVKAVVERYDGDGKDDMADLQIPVKFWEVMNEPDLTSPEPEPRLDFYTEDAAAYATLLIKTAKAIKAADPQAKVLIAGAAGGNDQFLSFYREVFKNKEAVSSFDIANIHCISNDNYDSFNVEPYKNMLKEFKISKPVWVTEAEAMISDDPDVNATQTYESTKKALALGAEKIFFTRFEFENFNKQPPPPGGKKLPEIKATIKDGNQKEAYKKITSLK